jgi:PadR family transcriptional regulator, regulatory protein PadR
LRLSTLHTRIDQLYNLILKESMSGPSYLGEFEQMVMWAVLRMRGEGYGAMILEELGRRVDREVSTGAFYSTLDRLEEKGMVRSRLADPDPKRGGRRRRYMTVTPLGVAALERTREEWMRLWEGVDPALLRHGR